ncbi:MAG: UDP-N-acetylglucosamine 1-carboxyvinyltransferase [Candidatus Portnoybacteria bacterium RIFCSPLOWO2_12_FULL_39_9]|uniref:UDP-N-acetylglucosamine 1-carboxyvinyltransferase n=1 Tax=Candidatus Portnoybacteria bacterium RIFCSPHIGHO2_12_FULL_38_9 TaxID=1801997 RepID=A0A1G2FEP6_9BACT|nr:MAG: UDP-N-acetylglucosamine 1-carboxyvinyltransferase [Candidatus Portnoybacteria bacterium RBG_13_40_8]OGZ36165.1 MAG: UDP-N-acetylglucosamine 1-carboxyvinyltransferase [Candidatus Portnoybacteria bacterium RIFCSPHIGHO2_02_FULL_39_12]OGZ36523.1 MAG: UDP-N-acetylglucosamine 1-carboxyvinyltransferase [Candidatus Portnoybacteria bacterium RIFCSPHIGHO2_12_FULL_38_9]OGZ41289.1 MAG: UDP-N-acetylglucosamine 1-carboxyvinyltransferase [Candidatus Portnoybacteria bacterium RIFCSPLOWO2_12_FULL_39_9]
MEKFVIKGGRPLKGTIEVKGAKNAALKVLAASLLSDEEWIISNVPQIEDIFRLVELLKGIGVQVENDSGDVYRLKATNILTSYLEPDIAQKLKGSIVMAGPLLARSGQAFIPYPGGCVIGQRPRDMFLDGFKSFGAEVRENRKGYHLVVKKLKGARFIFSKISVTATESLMLTAVLAQGKTILKNAACEPEIPALADFLNKCGARIKGAGTQTIEIEGNSRLLKKGAVKIIPDRIEAGTFALLAAATNGQMKITNCQPEHLEVLWALLEKAGVNFELGKDYILVKPAKKLKAVNIKTHEYPGFATDLQAPFTVLMTQAQGVSLIHETIFEGRLFYTDTLNQMGANIIMADPHRVLVNGPTKLYGRKIISPDIRAGIALVIAALIAKGKTEIDNIYQIDRGYERIEERLQKLGANISRICD